MPSYYIYASNGGHVQDLNTHVLPRNSNIDKFVSSLPGKGIALKNEPGPTSDFETSDTWAAWMSGLGTGLVPSLSCDGSPGMNIQSFRFAFVTPFSKIPIAFSTDSVRINDSFGNGTLPAKIPVPGINDRGDILYGGLESTTELKGTVADLFS